MFLVLRVLWVRGYQLQALGCFGRLGGCIAHTGALARGWELWRPILPGRHTDAGIHFDLLLQKLSLFCSSLASSDLERGVKSAVADTRRESLSDVGGNDWMDTLDLTSMLFEGLAYAGLMQSFRPQSTTRQVSYISVKNGGTLRHYKFSTVDVGENAVVHFPILCCLP